MVSNLIENDNLVVKNLSTFDESQDTIYQYDYDSYSEELDLFHNFKIQDAIKYWEDQCLITKKNTGYIINNIQEIELHKLYKPKTALSAEQLQKSTENQKRAKAIEFINNKYFSGLMPTTWYPEIELWFKKYNFDEEVMIARDAFNICLK